MTRERTAMTRLIACFALGALYASAQMTTEQRVVDFQTMASGYAKRYAPANWKIQAVRFNMFELGPWLTRVRAAKDDLEFYEICMEYVAGFQDTHSSYSMPSQATAWLGFAVDIYDGKVLIEQITRALLPEAGFPLQVGDEVVSVDGQTPEQLITYFSRFLKMGNPRATRRDAADSITFRWQGQIPRMLDLGESAQVVIRNAMGETSTHTIPWIKTATPVKNIGPVPTPRSEADLYHETIDGIRKQSGIGLWDLNPGSKLLRGVTLDDEGAEQPRRYVLGLGARAPIFTFPQGFTQRLGRTGADLFYSGTYMSQGQRIGYIRIPNFAPPSTALALQQFETEITFMQANTDGLVVDLMRNTGGGCIGLEYARRLIPRPFWFFGESLRPTLAMITSVQLNLERLIALRAERWLIDTIQFQLDALKSAYENGRGMTGGLPACSPTFENEPARNAQGQITAYAKPMIFLQDEFSISFGDIFPAMMQDNRRGPIVGLRSNGAGGSVSGFQAGYYSEAITRNTNSIVLRREPVKTPEFPEAPYIENIGVRPDIELDYMTRENLMERGRPFVDAFTRIMVDHIRASTPE